MKLLLSLLAVVATTFAETLNAREAVLKFSFSGQIIKSIENFRDQMPCGFENLGIPPLVPFKIEHQQIAINRESFKIDGEVNTVRVDGLNEFIIDNVKANALTQKIKIQLTFPKISVEGLYRLAAILKSYDITVNVQGDGDMKAAISDTVIKIDIKYSFSLTSKRITLKEVRIVIDVGDADVNIKGILGNGSLNRKLNEIIEEIILMSVNDNQEDITNFLDHMICDRVNNAGFTLDDVMGGGGESTVCTPP